MDISLSEIGSNIPFISDILEENQSSGSKCHTNRRRFSIWTLRSGNWINTWIRKRSTMGNKLGNELGKGIQYNHRSNNEYNNNIQSHRWPTIHLNPCGNAEASVIDINACKEKCANLSSTEIEKLRAQAAEGLGMKFALLLLSVEEAQLENSYNVAMRIEELQKILKLYDMVNVFTVNLLNKTNDNNAQTKGTIYW